MVEVLNSWHPVAKKEHRCQYCGGVIKVGKKYMRQTNVYEWHIYDWICHCDCEKIASELDMFGRTWRDGIDADEFNEFVWNAIYELRQNDEEAENMTTQEAIQWLLAQPRDVINKAIHYFNPKSVHA